MCFDSCYGHKVSSPLLSSASRDTSSCVVAPLVQATARLPRRRRRTSSEGRSCHAHCKPFWMSANLRIGNCSHQKGVWLFQGRELAKQPPTTTVSLQRRVSGRELVACFGSQVSPSCANAMPVSPAAPPPALRCNLVLLQVGIVFRNCNCLCQVTSSRRCHQVSVMPIESASIPRFANLPWGETQPPNATYAILLSG